MACSPPTWPNTALTAAEAVDALFPGPRPGRRGDDFDLTEWDQHRAKLLGNLVEDWVVNRVAIQLYIETKPRIVQSVILDKDDQSVLNLEHNRPFLPKWRTNLEFVPVVLCPTLQRCA